MVLRRRPPHSQQLTATVLFTDLHGFTGVSESLEPTVLMDWLNSYMDKMTQLVMKHGGVLDDYAGDGLKADFGVPAARTTEAEIGQDAINAVTCALEMERELANINENSRSQNRPTVAMRIGIYTGTVIGGSLGSAQRLKYTTVGDAVNTAARLESLDRDLIQLSLEQTDCRILIGPTTLEYLGQNFRTRYVGDFLLKGKADKIAVYAGSTS